MNYRVTCLTPTLIGGGHKLSPIDYMVWKDQVNVLDQTRIFKLLSRGPRLEGYLTQLRRATKLDFASWGGFAQNYADRRIPFESASISKHFDRAQGDALHIPLFAAGIGGPYLPATALKGAFRTAMLAASWNEGTTRELAERAKRRSKAKTSGGSGRNASAGRKRTESNALGRTLGFQANFLRSFQTLPGTRLYLDRKNAWSVCAWLEAASQGFRRRPPARGFNSGFHGNGACGTTFEGAWTEREFFNIPDIRKALRWSEPMSRERLFNAANEYARKVLDLHARYAGVPGLTQLDGHIQQLEAELVNAHSEGLASYRWAEGAGYLGKSALLETQSPDARELLSSQPVFERAIKSNLPFPKTRHIVFEQDQPSTLPGWVKFAAA